MVNGNGLVIVAAGDIVHYVLPTAPIGEHRVAIVLFVEPDDGLTTNLEVLFKHPGENPHPCPASLPPAADNEAWRPNCHYEVPPGPTTGTPGTWHRREDCPA